MQPLLFLLYLLYPGVSQAPNRSIDDVIERLNDKTWVIERTCIGDSCYDNKTTDYHYFFVSCNLYDGTYYKKGIAQESFRFGNDCAPRVTRIINDVQQPVINFIDAGANNDNSFPVTLSGEYYKKGARLTFLTRETFIVTSDYFPRKEYYRLVETPKEVLEFIKKH